MVGDFINKIKTTFDLNFHSYQPVKLHRYIYRYIYRSHGEAVHLKSLYTLVIRKKLVNNQN